MMSEQQPETKKVVITGGCGNLGIKLATHLLNQSNDKNNHHEHWSVVLLEHPDFYVPSRVPPGAEVILCDLCSSGDWKDALKGAHALVHLSAVNPYPNATWEESALSMSHTFNVFLAAVHLQLPRVILATSNHVMGGYKDLSGPVKPDMPPICGTALKDPKDAAESGDAVAYAAAKLAGEQLARSLAMTSDTSFLALRVGWCQPGANHPSTLCAAGVPPEYRNGFVDEKVDDKIQDEIDTDENWFKGMWLSNGDFLRLFTAALRVELPGNFAVLNAMSKNTGARWSLEETERLLGVALQDDSHA